jgi:hypothetical protein
LPPASPLWRPAKPSHRVEVQDFAAQRAVNTKAYLVNEKGIDASRISVATSETEGQGADNYLVPTGANFSADVPKTSAVDETAVKPIERKPLGQRNAQRAQKKAEATTTSK